MGELAAFWLLAGLVGVTGLFVVLARNAVASAIFLVVNLFGIAGLYALMQAHFVAAIQVLVYAGAIMVLFLFVIMLLNQAPQTAARLRLGAFERVALVVTLAGFIYIACKLTIRGVIGNGESAGIIGDTHGVGLVLFTRYLWPFELSSILILLAIVASIMVARKPTPVDPKKKG